jgi:hypothetical protein
MSLFEVCSPPRAKETASCVCFGFFFFSVGAATSVWVCVYVCVFVFWLKVANWLVVAVREREREGHWGRGGGRRLLYILKQASFGFLFEGLGGEREEI